jgi:hypothetical protein
MSARPGAGWWVVGCLMAAELASAQDLPAAARAELAAVQQEVAGLRAEVSRLRAELAALRSAVGDPPRATPVPAKDSAAAPAGPMATAPTAQEPHPTLPPEMLQTQIAELAQVKVESASRLPVRLFGAIHAHAFLNSAEANWLDQPNVVAPAPAGGHTGTFSASLRQTRVGLMADGPTIRSARTSGVLAVDFFGGMPGFQTGQVMALPRLLVAFARIEGARSALQVGQDHVVLAPRDPTSLAAQAFPALFRSGNLYLRAPQVRAEHRRETGLEASVAIVAPVAGDVPGEAYRFVPPALSGERSRQPAYQARLGFRRGGPEDRRSVSLGLSGHYGRERRDASTAKSRAAAIDFAIRRNLVGVAGECFVGDNLDAFGGGLGLDARAAGGWFELQVGAPGRLSAHAGAGLDELRGPGASLAPRRRNRSLFGNIIWSLTPEVEASVEYRWLATKPGSGPERANHHLDWVLMYRF